MLNFLYCERQKVLCADVRKAEVAAVATATYRVSAKAASFRCYAKKKSLEVFPRAVAGEERGRESTANFHAKSSDQKFDSIACTGVCLAVRGRGGGNSGRRRRDCLSAPCFFKVSSLARLAFFSNLSVPCVSSFTECPSSLQSVFPSFGLS